MPEKKSGKMTLSPQKNIPVAPLHLEQAANVLEQELQAYNGADAFQYLNVQAYLFPLLKRNKIVFIIVLKLIVYLVY